MGIGYFDNAATTLRKPDGMYQFMAEYMERFGGNSGRGEYQSAKNAGAIIRETRDLLLELTHCNSTEEVVFTPSATIALNCILRGLKLKQGDCVYVSHFEHNAVMRSLYDLQVRIGVEIEYLQISKGLQYNLSGIKTQFERKKPSLVVVSQVSNVCGLIAPVQELAVLAKQFNANVVVDASQACGVIDIALNYIDYYVFAGHKTLLGPFGAAGFICRKNSSLKPLLFGGTGVDSANREMPRSIPERFEAGSINIMAIAGLNFSLKWILKTGIEKIRAQENERFVSLINILRQYDEVSFVGQTENASAILSTQFEGYAPNEMGRIFNDFGISVRTGLHCAPEAHRFLGTFPEGTVRFSVSYFTNDEDLSLLKRAMNEISEQL